jgi:hypothetical protein
MNVDWYGVEEQLRTQRTAVHVGVQRGWSSSVSKGETIIVGCTKAKVMNVRYFASWDEIPDVWRTRHRGDIPDPVTASNYGLYGVLLFKID